VPIICPTITAEDLTTYNLQIEKVTPFVHRIQIDLMDGKFTPNKSVSPAEAWWPVGMKADVHLMFSDPTQAAQEVIKHSPNLIIIHAEADGDFQKLYELCRHKSVKIGLALLASTDPKVIKNVLSKIDHVLIFSGNLGHQGGSVADLALLEKVKYLKERNPELEIGWDGGINDRNVSELVFGGVDVLNVGGFIQNAENPEKAYNVLFRIADETGTT
jgi:ribulose-phosphate 3-epimerase